MSITEALFKSFVRGMHAADPVEIDMQEAREQFHEWLGREYAESISAKSGKAEQALTDLLARVNSLCFSCVGYANGNDEAAGFACLICGNKLGNFRFEAGKHDESCRLMAVINALSDYVEKAKRKVPTGE